MKVRAGLGVLGAILFATLFLAAVQPTCVPVPVECPDGTLCDDGDPCTDHDVCVGGVCRGEGCVCQCCDDVDCEAYGDLCNGALLCGDGVCRVDPASVTVCPPSDAPCRDVLCEPTTGACVEVNAPDGTPCEDDANRWTVDVCRGGLCTHHADPADGFPCQSDADCPGGGWADCCASRCDTEAGACLPATPVYACCAGDADCAGAPEPPCERVACYYGIMDDKPERCAGICRLEWTPGCCLGDSDCVDAATLQQGLCENIGERPWSPLTGECAYPDPDRTPEWDCQHPPR